MAPRKKPSHIDDWEDLSEDPTSLYDQIADMKVSEASLKDKRQVKQRGRGAFTFGEMGLYSDRTAQDSNAGESVSNAGESLGTSIEKEQIDWEDLSEDPASLYDQIANMKVSEASLKDKRQVKQRGRGAFTFGEMGLYSDRTAQDANAGESVSNAGESVGTSIENEQTDWEDLIERPALSAMKASDASPKDTCQVKHRGRGTFTFGEMGLYSDRWSEQNINTGESVDTSIAHEAKGEYGAGHVLIVDGFQPTATTKDLEDLFKPYIKTVIIRWVNDTTALAVFPNPAVAQEALHYMRNPNFKIHLLDNENQFSILLEGKDLEPPVVRPATSSEAAQRMIAGALGGRGLSKALRPKSNFQEIQKQEDERKKRLLNRQKLRDEAWGPDD